MMDSKHNSANPGSKGKLYRCFVLRFDISDGFPRYAKLCRKPGTICQLRNAQRLLRRLNREMGKSIIFTQFRKIVFDKRYMEAARTALQIDLPPFDSFQFEGDSVVLINEETDEIEFWKFLPEGSFDN